MTSIQIFRGAVPLTIIKPDATSSQDKAVLGDSTLTLNFEQVNYVNFRVGDWCMVFGSRYLLFKTPVITKSATNNYKFTLRFQEEGVRLLTSVQFLFLDVINQVNEAAFSLMGNADTFMDLLITNMNRVYPGFTKGQVVATGYKNLTFNGEDCFAVLGRLAEAFDTEFWIEGTTVHLTKQALDTGITFRQGKFKGLYDVTLKDLNDAAVITRIYVYGADKNLPGDYRSGSKRLRLPVLPNEHLVTNVTVERNFSLFTFNFTPPTGTGIVSLHLQHRLAGSNAAWEDQPGAGTSPRSLNLISGEFEFRFVTEFSGASYETAVFGVGGPFLVDAPLSYLERNTAKYGVIERTELFEDVYPHRTGVVTSVNAANPFEFIDNGMNFNVNNYLQPGQSAKVVFNTGQLAGYQFQISSYNNSTKTFVLLKNDAELNLTVPSAAIRPAIGDEYVIIDIKMPDAYIAAAETELLNKAAALLQVISEPQVSYSVTVDPAFVKQKKLALTIGQLVWLIDSDLGIQKKIRITNLSRNVVEESAYKVELSDTVSPGKLVQILAATADNTRGVAGLASALSNNSILNNHVIGTLDFDGMPETATMSGFDQIVIEMATGKLFRKV